MRKLAQSWYEVRGYRQYDKVLAKGRLWHIAGRRAKGSFVLKNLCGEVLDITPTKITFVKKQYNYVLERRGWPNGRDGFLPPPAEFLRGGGIHRQIMMKKKKLYSASFTWNGKVITKRATTKEEAEKKRDQEKFMYEFGLKSLSSDILVKDWYPEWAEKYKHGRLSERAYKDDNSRIERFILPAIGHKKMRDVKQLDLMRILESMNETGYSKTSIMKVKSCMTQMFRDAIPNDIISHSPAAELPVPIGTKQARHIVITDEDRLAIINCKSKVHLWAMFLMFSGARPAEALILKYSDLYPDHHAVFLNGTKTANAKRYVPLPDSIMDSILATKESSYGDYVFSDRVDGAPYNRNQTGRNWKRLINDVNISLGCDTYFS